MLASLALAACQDLGTLPEELATAPSTHAREASGTIEGAVPGAERYVCYTSVATPGGKHAYRYGRIALRFPAAAMHPTNATHRYRYRMVNPSGRVLRVANCVIPRSERAVELMNRRFGVPDAGEAVQVQGCVSGGICTLDPVIVIGDGSGSDGGWYGGGGGGGGGGDDGGSDPGPGDGQCLSSLDGFDTVQGCYLGGGDISDPGDPDAWDDGTGRPPCERDANKQCVTRDLSPEEWDRLGRAIQAIREDSPECKGAKDALLGLYSQGREADRFRFWDGYDKYWDAELGEYQQRVGENTSDVRGRVIEYDSYWVWNDPTLVVHEGLHLWLFLTNSPLMGNANETWVRTMAPNCI